MSEADMIKKKELDELLRDTYQAHSSAAAIERLRINIARTYVDEDAKKLGRVKLNDEAIQYIYDLLYEKLPAGFFWERFIYYITRDMIMYKFEEASSVGMVDKFELERQVKLFPKHKLNLYRSISLKEHLFDAVKEYLEYEHLIPHDDRFVVLCSVVLHDFGKSSFLVEAHLKDETEKKIHEKMSYVYVMNIAKVIHEEYQSLIEESMIAKYQYDQILRIAECVLSHHDKFIEAGSITDHLKMIDHKTREKEWQRHINKEAGLLENFLNKGE